MAVWYGGTSREIEIVTGTGHWYRIGEALVAVRWVYIHDCTGTHRDEYLFTTDLSLRSATGRGVLYPTLVYRDDIPGMPRIPEAGIDQGL